MDPARLSPVFSLLALAVSAGGWALPPPNDALIDAQEITTLPFIASVEVSQATVDPGDPELDCAPVGSEHGFRSVWYRFQFGEDTRVRVDAASSEFTPIIEMFQNAGTVSSPELESVGVCDMTTLEVDIPAGISVYMVLADGEDPPVGTALRFRMDRTVSDIVITVQQVADWIVGLLYLDPVQLLAPGTDDADANDDGVVDVADIVFKLNLEEP
jgi:hypothetical protein